MTNTELTVAIFELTCLVRDLREGLGHTVRLTYQPRELDSLNTLEDLLEAPKGTFFRPEKLGYKE